MRYFLLNYPCYQAWNQIMINTVCNRIEGSFDRVAWKYVHDWEESVFPWVSGCPKLGVPSDVIIIIINIIIQRPLKIDKDELEVEKNILL